VKTLSATLALVGFLLATALIGWFGFSEVLTATLAAGWSGLLLLTAWQIVLFVVLAAAWAVIVPPRETRRAWIFLWGRMVRDAAGNCLPFSHMGGFVAGARAVTLHGMAWPLATASTLVDVTAEVLAQIAFAAIGLVILIAHAPDSALALPVAAGLAVALPAMGAFIWLQQGAVKIFGKLGQRIAGEWFADAQERVAVLREEISLLYGHAGRLALGSAIHLLAWIGTGIGGWIAFRLLGAEISLVDALAIEALLHAVLAVAFLVPGYAGVQEAAYLALGAAFGVPPEIALGVSLLRRARDIAVGIPILLVWQFFEARRWRQRGTRPSSG
jgi:putative membrane protein